MGSILDAISAAAASLQGEPQVKVTQKTVQPIAKPATKVASKTKGSQKEDERKTKGGAKYVIPKEFKQAIEDYLNRRDDIANKLKNPEKSIDGCCDYIYGRMLKQATAMRKGATTVGMAVPREEIFGMAVHYYDESNADLKKEK